MNNNKKIQAIQAFKNYAANFDTSNISIALKISHTFRVAEISEKIAATIQGIDSGLAWLLGLLHDVGRFEQVTKFGTFKDSFSIDHAELGADILFRENLINEFSYEGSVNNWQEITETAIRVHNKLKIPAGLPEATKIYSNILRDADKTDIFRVLTEPPYDKRDLESLSVRDEILRCVREHHCVPRAAIEVNALEALTAQCSMAFEIVYPETKKIILAQGFLKKLLDQLPEFIREEFVDFL